MAPRLVLAFLLVVALTAGCIGGTANPQDPSSAAAPQGAQAGSPSDHGSPERDETAVTATRQGSTWIVRQTITLSNDFGGASHSDITLDTLNGDVTMAAGGNGGYEVVANLFGQGNTEAQARDALDKLRYTDVDSLDGSTLTLTVQVKSTVQQLPQGESHGASFSAKLPPQPSHGLSADSSNGKLTITGLHGGSVALDSSNGDLTVSGVFAKVVADTSNGAIGLSGTFNAITADTSNGAITATVRSTASGALRFSSSNADIRVTLEAGSDRGFDVSGDTSNGEVTIDLGDAQAADEDDASARSDGYAGKAIKLDVDADTSNADITITAK